MNATPQKRIMKQGTTIIDLAVGLVGVNPTLHSYNLRKIALDVKVVEGIVSGMVCVKAYSDKVSVKRTTPL